MKKIISIILCLGLILDQPVYGQVISQMPMPAYLSGFSVSDRFRPVHARAFSFDPTEQLCRLVLDKGDAKALTAKEFSDNTQKLWEYFQIGLRLPNSSFWVNLRPDGQGGTIDPELEKTDVGRILLEADLQLKKDLARFSSPQTPEGKAYWNKLYERAEQIFGQQDISIPTVTRPWIVPGDVILLRTADGVYIQKANLRVMLEQDYLKFAQDLKPAGGSPAGSYQFSTKQEQELNEYSTQLIRQLILPKLIKEVNASRRYAQFRQVYYSLVLAQWIKSEQGAFEQGAISKVIDQKDLTGLISKQAWSKDTIVKSYRASFEKGEYNIQETIPGPQGLIVRQYFSGGAALQQAAGTVIYAGAGKQVADLSKQDYLVPTQELRIDSGNGLIDSGNAPTDGGSGQREDNVRAGKYRSPVLGEDVDPVKFILSDDMMEKIRMDSISMHLPLTLASSAIDEAFRNAVNSWGRGLARAEFGNSSFGRFMLDPSHHLLRPEGPLDNKPDDFHVATSQEAEAKKKELLDLLAEKGIVKPDDHTRKQILESLFIVQHGQMIKKEDSDTMLYVLYDLMITMVNEDVLTSKEFDGVIEFIMHYSASSKGPNATDLNGFKKFIIIVRQDGLPAWLLDLDLLTKYIKRDRILDTRWLNLRDLAIIGSLIKQIIELYPYVASPLRPGNRLKARLILTAKDVFQYYLPVPWLANILDSYYPEITKEFSRKSEVTWRDVFEKWSNESNFSITGAGGMKEFLKKLIDGAPDYFCHPEVMFEIKNAMGIRSDDALKTLIQMDQHKLVTKDNLEALIKAMAKATEKHRDEILGADAYFKTISVLVEKGLISAKNTEWAMERIADIFYNTKGRDQQSLLQVLTKYALEYGLFSEDGLINDMTLMSNFAAELTGGNVISMGDLEITGLLEALKNKGHLDQALMISIIAFARGEADRAVVREDRHLEKELKLMKTLVEKGVLTKSSLPDFIEQLKELNLRVYRSSGVQDSDKISHDEIDALVLLAEEGMFTSTNSVKLFDLAREHAPLIMKFKYFIPNARVKSKIWNLEFIEHAIDLCGKNPDLLNAYIQSVDFMIERNKMNEDNCQAMLESLDRLKGHEKQFSALNYLVEAEAVNEKNIDHVIDSLLDIEKKDSDGNVMSLVLMKMCEKKVISADTFDACLQLIFDAQSVSSQLASNELMVLLNFLIQHDSLLTGDFQGNLEFIKYVAERHKAGSSKSDSFSARLITYMMNSKDSKILFASPRIFMRLLQTSPGKEKYLIEFLHRLSNIPLLDQLDPEKLIELCRIVMMPQVNNEDGQKIADILFSCMNELNTYEIKFNDLQFFIDLLNAVSQEKNGELIALKELRKLIHERQDMFFTGSEYKKLVPVFSEIFSRGKSNAGFALSVFLAALAGWPQETGLSQAKDIALRFLDYAQGDHENMSILANNLSGWRSSTGALRSARDLETILQAVANQSSKLGANLSNDVLDHAVIRIDGSGLDDTGARDEFIESLLAADAFCDEFKDPKMFELFLERCESITAVNQHVEAVLSLLNERHPRSEKPWQAEDLYMRLLPAPSRQALLSAGYESVLSDVSADNYTQDLYSSALFVKLRSEFGLSRGIRMNDFIAIIRGMDTYIDARQATLVRSFAANIALGHDVQITSQQQKEIMALSIELYNQMAQLVRDQGYSDVVITFRELVRFNVDFSRYFSRAEGLTNVFEIFILTAANVYGRVIKDENAREAFINIIASHIDQHGELFGQALLTSTLFKRLQADAAIRQVIDFGDYEDLARNPSDGDIPLEVNIEALIKRSTQVARPLLVSLGKNNSIFFYDVIKKLMRQNDTVVVPVAASRFTRRQDFFGMYLPKQPLSEDGVEAALSAASQADVKQALGAVLNLKPAEAQSYADSWLSNDEELTQDQTLRWAMAMYLIHKDRWKELFTWHDGVLVRLAQQALNNPAVTYYFVMENIEACPDRVRVLLNPVLWEKTVEIPEKSTRLALPRNLQFVFTMHNENRIDDPAFMDRFLVQHVSEPKKNDILRYLMLRENLTEDIAKYILRNPSKLSVLDCVEMARRISGVAQEQGVDQDKVYIREMMEYAYFRLKDTAITGSAKKIILSDGLIDFNGVRITASAQFLDYAGKHPGESFNELVRGFFAGYVVSDMETRMLCQLARALKYGSKVVQLEGPSGEGKTQIARVFAGLIGYPVRETTVNEGTDLSEYVGRIQPHSRGYELSLSPYLDKIEEGGHVFINNEINTSPDQGVYYLLFNEISGMDSRYITQFPLQGKGDEILKRARIQQNNLWLFTVNPDNFQGRDPTPPVVSSLVPVLYFESPLTEIPYFIERILNEKDKDDKIRADSFRLSRMLAEIHYDLKQYIDGRKTGTRQTLTKRELLRAIDKIEKYSKDMDIDDAFFRAVMEVYAYMWTDQDIMDEAKQKIQHVSESSSRYKNLSALDTLASLVNDGKPILVMSDTTQDQDFVEGVIRAQYPQAKIISAPVSYFHRERQFLGGMVPLAHKQAKQERLPELRPQLENALGILPAVIEQARFSPQQPVFLVLYNYTHLNPRVAPLLNEFLQTGQLESVGKYVTAEIAQALIERIRQSPEVIAGLEQEYSLASNKKVDLSQPMENDSALAFAQWFYSKMPGNVHLVASGSSSENTHLSQAELDRFLVVNVFEKDYRKWLADYCRASIPGQLKDQSDVIAIRVMDAYDLYEEQKNTMFYAHNRLGKADIDAFMQELSSRQKLDENELDRIAYYVFGIGLRSEFSSKLFYAPDSSNAGLRYEQRADGIYLIADVIEYKTNLSALPADEFLAPTSSSIQQIAAMLLALKYNRPIILEGNPGGGKTSACEDLARRLGIPSYKVMMFEDIDLGQFLGQMTMAGNNIDLTSRPDSKGNYSLDFLKAYTEGGIYTLDEGAIGINSQEVIQFLIMLSQMQEFDLGIFHPGMQGTVLKRHKDFHLAVTQNPARTTKAREPLTYTVDTSSAKIWVNNMPTEADAMMIIRYYLQGSAQSVPEDLQRSIANAHIRLVNYHPHKEELSPRQLIMVSGILKEAVARKEPIQKAVFMGMMLAYCTGLSKEEFSSVWKELTDVLGPDIKTEFEQYLLDWQSPIATSVDNGQVIFNGIRLPRSSGQTNVSREDIQIPENIPDYNIALRAMALGVSLHYPIAFLEDDGADSLDMTRLFANLTGYELHTLWSHPQMTKVQLLSSFMPRFEQAFDTYGIRQQEMSHEFLVSLGFLLRYMLTEEDCRGRKGTPQAHQILYLNFFDAIPERQRVMLNEILTTKRMVIQNEKGEPVTYLLPEWVHIVVSSSVDHKFSSAFINRFLKLRVSAVSGYDSLKQIINNRYPLVNDSEIGLIKILAETTASYDRERAFGLHYGFSPKDAMKLARAVQFEKQFDIAQGKFNQDPLYYVVKAAYIVYVAGLEEFADRQKFEDDVMIKTIFAGVYYGYAKQGEQKVMYDLMKKRIESELSTIGKSSVSARVDIARLALGKSLVLKNGITVERRRAGFVISTPGNTYILTDEQLAVWQELSKDLRVKKENGQLIFSMDIAEQIGGIAISRSKENVDRSLPEDEIGEFIRYTSQIKVLVAGLLRSWQRLKDAQGRTYQPRVVFLNGETGTAKTTLIRNLSKMMGVPLYILNAYADLKVSDITVGFKMVKGEVELGVKEFLARCGTINGQRLYVASKATSSRSILLIDEANASPEILYALMPLLRGEKKFTVEYAGESFEVEMDDEVMVVLTFNPAETYSGRESFSPEIAFYADKLWAPNPSRYGDEELLSILSEYHRRGITAGETEKGRQASGEMISESFEGYFSVAADVTQAQSLPVPGVFTPQQMMENNYRDKEFAEVNSSNGLPDELDMDTLMRKGKEVIGDGEAGAGESQHVSFPYDVDPRLYRIMVHDELKENGWFDPQIMISSAKTENKIPVPADAPPKAWRVINGEFMSGVGKDYVSIPTPVPGNMLRVISGEMELSDGKRVKLEFAYGKDTGMLYVRCQDYQGYGLIKIKLAIDSKVYFGNRLPEGKIAFEDRKTVSPEKRKIAMQLLENMMGYKSAINISNRESLSEVYDKRAVIYSLIEKFRDFGLDENGIDRNGQGDTAFLKIVSSRQGVCRHRAYAFFVLTYILGFKTRFVSNDQHAFCEILLENGSWVRADLGGGGDPANMDFSDASDMQEVEETGDFPETVSRQSKEIDQKYKERMKEAVQKKGRSGKGGKGSRGGGIGISPSGEGEFKSIKHPDTVSGRIQTLTAIAPNLVLEFLSVFASDSKVIREYLDSGDELDIEKIITKATDPFFVKRTVKEKASFAGGITIDVSGSTQFDHLDEHFNEMAKFYTSLFYLASELNKGVEFSLSAIGDDFHRLVDFEECRKLHSVEKGLGMITNLNDRGGINTVNVINGIREKYKNQKSKEHRMEIVLTDGEDTTRKGKDELRRLVEDLEKELNIDVVFIGIKTKEVRIYPKYLVLEKVPEVKDLIKMIMRLSLAKVAEKGLPAGDLKTVAGLDGGIEDKKMPQPVKDGGKGGIDLRAIPAQQTPVLTQRSSADSGKQISPEELNKRFQEICSSIKSGEMPYARINDYVSCCRQCGADACLARVYTYLSDVLRSEEEQGLSSTPEMLELIRRFG